MLVCACVCVHLQMCVYSHRQAIWLLASSSVVFHLSFWDKVQLIFCLGWLISPSPGITGEQDPYYSIAVAVLFCFTWTLVIGICVGAWRRRNLVMESFPQPHFKHLTLLLLLLLIVWVFILKWKCLSLPEAGEKEVGEGWLIND